MRRPESRFALQHPTQKSAFGRVFESRCFQRSRGLHSAYDRVPEPMPQAANVRSVGVCERAGAVDFRQGSRRWDIGDDRSARSFALAISDDCGCRCRLLRCVACRRSQSETALLRFLSGCGARSEPLSETGSSFGADFRRFVAFEDSAAERGSVGHAVRDSQ